jgi:hypothetical protein
LGLRPESLSRAFAKLKSAGVKVDAARVAVSEVGTLRRFVADDGCMSRLYGSVQDMSCRQHGTLSNSRDPVVPARPSR